MMKHLQRNKIIVLAIMIFIIGICCFKIVTTKVFTKNNDNDFSGFKELNMEKVKLHLKYEGNDLSLKLPIYVDSNRYHIPVNEIISKLGGETEVKKDKLHLKLDKLNVIVDIKNNSFNKDVQEHKLRKKVVFAGNVAYMSMFDFTKIFNLKIYWDYQTNSIWFYKNTDNVMHKKRENNDLSALIRLEDITAGGLYASGETLEKLRIISDYLYKESIPFHVAWVPRYINPSLKIDNDPSEKYSIYNSDFVFTMDYFADKNGLIGLHGYTHQYGDSESVDGIEFHRSSNDNIPADKEYAQDRIKKALTTAERLDIKWGFFEVPHYAILPSQLDVVEKSFDYIYEPYSVDGGITEYNEIVTKNNNGKKIIYVPTPLNYIDGKKDCNNMLKKINLLDEGTLASFFYHPYIEFDDIKIYRDNKGNPCYQYSSESVLHQVIHKFKSKGYKFIKINEVT